MLVCGDCGVTIEKWPGWIIANKKVCASPEDISSSNWAYKHAWVEEDLERRLKVKSWLAVLASNAKVKLDVGMLDKLADLRNEWSDLAMVLSPNDDNMITYFKNEMRKAKAKR